MTVNVTMITPAFSVQASDRRTINALTGEVVREDANKGVILQSADGVFAITFSGIGQVGDQRVDQWLAERMAREGVAELPIEEGLEITRSAVSLWFRTFPGNVDARHTFVVSGWLKSGEFPVARTWLLSNCVGADERMLPSATPTFRLVPREIKPRRGQFWVHGQLIHIDRGTRRRLKAADARRDVDFAERAIVERIRWASGQPQWKNAINGEVLTVSLSPDGVARSTLYPSKGRTANYAPLFVWYESGRNIAAGDAEIRSSTGWGFKFGESLLVSNAGGRDARIPVEVPQDEEFEIRFSHMWSPAKFRNEVPGESPTATLIKYVRSEKHGPSPKMT